MVHAKCLAHPCFHLLSKNTEAAPNSSTGSGPGAFPRQDGFASFSLRRAFETQRPRNLSVPHAGQANRQARSPKGKRTDRRGLRCSNSSGSSAASRAAQVGGDDDRFASAQLVVGSARGQPRVDSSRSKVSVTGAAANPSVRGRACAAPEPGWDPGPRCWLRLAVARDASVRPPARHAGPRWFNCCS